MFAAVVVLWCCGELQGVLTAGVHVCWRFKLEAGGLALFSFVQHSNCDLAEGFGASIGSLSLCTSTTINQPINHTTHSRGCRSTANSLSSSDPASGTTLYFQAISGGADTCECGFERG